MPDYYEIRLKGQLDPRWSDWLMGMQLAPLPGNETLLFGSLPDQVALHGLLERIRDLNWVLISVSSEKSSSHDPDKE